MLALHSQHPMLRLFRAGLPRLLGLVTPLALGACQGADSPLAPDDTSPPATAVSAAPDHILAAGTGQWIVFASFRNSFQPDIYKTDPLGNTVVPLTPSFSDYDAAPAVSYDNQRIAMVRRRMAGNPLSDDIYVINADGGNGHWVRPTQYPFQLADPSWSPDGTRIVLTVLLNGGTYLATMDVASGQVSLVSPAGIRGEDPSYDPTGQKIIYVSHDLRSIQQVNADGTGQKVRFSSATPIGHPTFSPNGKKIAFHRIVSSTYPDIFVKNLVDGSVKRLTSAVASDIHPTWSPDGSRIAFASLRSGKYQIYTVSAAGGIATRITNTGTDERSPAWSH